MEIILHARCRPVNQYRFTDAKTLNKLYTRRIPIRFFSPLHETFDRRRDRNRNNIIYYNIMIYAAAAAAAVQ